MNKTNLPQLSRHNRRTFIRTAALAVAGATLSRAFATTNSQRLSLGFDNFAVRGLGLKAPQLLELARDLKCDALFISDLASFETLDPAKLQALRSRSNELNIALYLGSWSICPSSTKFAPTWGTAEEHLATGIRVAQALGSPVFRVILGTSEDRKTPGGISARIADTVKVLKSCRTLAEESGVKIAVENHAGDMTSRELLRLIQDAGPEFVGANFDSGNAAWTLEDPLDAFEVLAPHILCSSLRDVMAWSTPEGAAVAWTAAGEGLIDWDTLLKRWSEACPKVPVFIETISGFSRNFPFKQPDFQNSFSIPPEALTTFESFVSRGKSVAPFKVPEGVDPKQAHADYQRAELQRSLEFLRQKEFFR